MAFFLLLYIFNTMILIIYFLLEIHSIMNVLLIIFNIK